MRYFIEAQQTELDLRLRLDRLSSPEFEEKTARLKLPTENRTILVLGLSHTGKTTFVNGLLNYLLDIQFEDYFRYEVQDEHIGKSRYMGAITQTNEQTTRTTAYLFQKKQTIYTIIDTPGFGHSSSDGCAFDDYLMEVISKKRGKVSLAKIDAICLVDCAPNSQASEVNFYWLERVLKLFNGHSKDNVILVKTFGTGDTSRRQSG